MAMISPLQMTDATNWKGLTSENHLGALWAQSPQKMEGYITKILQKNFGNNIESVLAKYPTKYFEDDTDYTWQLESQAVQNVPLVEARINGVAVTSADKPGYGLTEFELVFGIDWFDDTEKIVGEKNELYPVRIVSEGTPEGTNFVYKAQMYTSDPKFFMPVEELAKGKKFSIEYAPVERTMSQKGRKPHYKSNITMKNSFSQIRMEKKTPGNMKSRKLGTVILGDNGEKMATWLEYESLKFMKEFKDDINRLLYFGTSNRGKDGNYATKGKSGYPIVEGSGIREQMQSSNTSYYTTFSIKELSSRLLDLSEGKLAGDEREFVLRTGERGAVQFHEALEGHTQLFQPLQNTDRMYKTTMKNIKMGYGYGGQFIEYMGPNGIKVSLSIDSMYDDRNRNKVMHPNGGVAESYRYDIFDIGTTDGSPNIQKVGVKGQPEIIHKYIPGLRNPFDPDGKITAIGTAEDSWEEHKMFIGGVCVKDPSRTASFIPAILA